MNQQESLRAEILNLVEKFGRASVEFETEFHPGDSPVPVSGKVLDSADFVSLVDASLDGWLTSGRFHKTFEQELAKFVGVRNSVFVNSGSRRISSH